MSVLIIEPPVFNGRPTVFFSLFVFRQNEKPGFVRTKKPRHLRGSHEDFAGGFGRRLPAHAHGQGQAGSGWEDLGEEERFATEPGSGVGEAPLMARRVGSSGHLGVAPLVGASPGPRSSHHLAAFLGALGTLPTTL